MADTVETKIKKQIVAYLDQVPELWHVPFHNVGYARKGIPDRLICYRGRFVAIEVKAPGKKPTPWQMREIGSLAAAGAVAAVVYSLQDVVDLLQRVK